MNAKIITIVLFLLLIFLQINIVFADQITEENFKVAFIGDTGAGTPFRDVLQFIKNEGADMVVIPGDLQYSTSSVSAWVTAVHDVLGDNFPLLVSRGNHEPSNVWGSLATNNCSGTVDTYSEFVNCRLNNLSVTPVIDNNDNADQYSVVYKGFKMVFLGDPPDSTKYTNFINQQLNGDNHIWKLCAWHQNQRATNVGTKDDKVGWSPFEACRTHGAFIAQAHSHTYSRSKTLTNMELQTIDNTCQDIPSTANFDVCVSREASFFFDSSLGGRDPEGRSLCSGSSCPVGKNYMANWYTGATGALFLEFNVDGDPYKARGYFKNILNQTIDSFEIIAFQQKVLTPFISPNGGIFIDSVLITITTSTHNASIYYTTDGTIPNELSNLHSGEFIINTNTTIKAIAIKSGLNNSDIASATFQIRQNNIPVADANGPYQGTEDISITFNGSASFDADGDNLTYYWYFGDGTNGTGINPQHAYNSGGIYYVTLCVSDGFNKSPLSSTNVTVTEINDAPIANAGNDIIKEDFGGNGIELITLTGIGTDTDGFITNYEWKENSIILGNNPVLTYNFTLGNHTLNFTVTDNDGAQSSDSVMVTVLPSPVQSNVSNLTLFSDNFESGFGKWTESNEFDWNIEKPAEKNISNHTLPNLVAHADKCTSSNGCVITMKNKLNLSNYKNATLKFYRYIDNGLDSGEFLRVQVLKSGVWNTIFDWTNKKGDDDKWHYETFNLSNYLVSDFNLRFVSKESSGSEEVEIDDVLITGILS